MPRAKASSPRPRTAGRAPDLDKREQPPHNSDLPTETRQPQTPTTVAAALSRPISPPGPAHGRYAFCQRLWTAPVALSWQIQRRTASAEDERNQQERQRGGAQRRRESGRRVASETERERSHAKVCDR